MILESIGELNLKHRMTDEARDLAKKYIAYASTGPCPPHKRAENQRTVKTVEKFVEGDECRLKKEGAGL